MKKFILVVAGLIGFLVVAFLCVGFFVPAVEYTTIVVIDRPRDVTWSVMRDRKDWIYGFKSSEQISGTPNEPGSRARVTVVRDGRETTFDTELIEIKPPEYTVNRLWNDMLTHDATVRLTEVDGKTRVVSDERLTGSNIFWRSIFAIFRSSIVSTSRKNFDGLKQAVESTN
ncbi:MAG: hypothetical protein JO053_02250 [Acidobacteria bacterium]|nr:hypothetical protein [Acidobacteriota bacterium]